MEGDEVGPGQELVQLHVLHAQLLLNAGDMEDDAIILEFKVHSPEEESSLEETVQAALRQIEEKKYEQQLLDRGIGEERIRKYGFAFEGKKVLIG